MTHRQTERLRVGVALDLTWNLKRHTDIFAGVTRYAQEHEDLLCIIDDFADDTLATSEVSPYDGIIGRITPQLAEAASAAGLPMVNVWFSSPVTDLPSVFSDNAAAGQLLAEHMLTRGIRRFLCIMRRGDAGEKSEVERFVETVDEFGGKCTQLAVPQSFAHTAERWRKTRGLIEKWLSQVSPPAAVVTGVDIVARHVAQICSEIGLRVPEDIAIGGGYNEPSICNYPEPSLTSIEYGLDRVGYEAARLLHDLMRGVSRKEQRMVLPPRELIVRQSSDFIYVDEEVVSAAIQFISKNATKSLSVDDVAKAVGVSRRTLEMRFEKHVGRSVAGEIRRMRIDQAKRLLASSDESIAMIARLTGIGTPQQFARVFRREVGVNPRQYRRQLTTTD